MNQQIKTEQRVAMATKIRKRMSKLVEEAKKLPEDKKYI